MYEHAVCSKEFQGSSQVKHMRLLGIETRLLCFELFESGVFRMFCGRYLGDLQRQGYL